MLPDKGTVIASSSSSGASNVLLQFRERMAPVLKKYPAYDTVITLERWLGSYDYDIEKAAEQMTWAVNGLDAIGACRVYDNVESLNDLLRSLNPAFEYFPGGIMGPDKYGNIVFIQPMGRARPRTMMRLGRVSDLYRASILEAEACMSFLRKEEAKRGCKLGIILISDFAELSRETVYMPAVKAYMNVLNVLQRFFPDSIKKVFVINSPDLISVLFTIAKRVLSKKMIENIEFLSSDWKHRLRDELGEENIFKHWGGTKKIGTKDTGTIRMAGEIPYNLRDEILKTLKFIPGDQLTKKTIPAGETLKISISIPRANSLLQWYFTINTGDIEFKITHNKIEVWPRFHLSTEFVPEYGEIVCREAGIYVLHFNNLGKLFSKSIAYNILVISRELSSSSLISKSSIS